MKLYRLLIIFLVTLTGCQSAHANESDTPCSGARPVSWSETIRANDGVSLYLLTRGDHCNAPVLLWLHGGPGGAERPLFRLYNSTLEQNFTVAYWDQRGAGRSFDPNAGPSELTIARHLRDLNIIVDHLRARLGQRKIILVGHSWGATLGLLYAHDHPENTAAIVAVAPFVAGLDNERTQYAFIKAQAQNQKDAKALDKLSEIGNPPFAASEVLPVQQLVDHFGGDFHIHPNFFWTSVKGVFHGYVTPWEIAKIIHGNNVSLTAMHNEIQKLDLRKSVTTLKVPVVFMLGRFDDQADARIAANYFEKLDAPVKDLIWFENSAHNIPFEEPTIFNEKMVGALRVVGVLSEKNAQ